MAISRVAGNAITVAITIVLCAVVFEFGLRIVAPDMAPEPVTGDQYEFYAFDPQLGWATTPNVHGVFQRREYSHDMRINSLGLRGPEIALAKPPGKRRVAVLGDSFTWGMGVNENDLYVSLIGQAIPNTEMLNFGVSGYGPVHYALMTDRVLEFSPDVVVVAFCLGNDFSDNVFWRRYTYYKPFARVDERGELVIDGYPLPNVRRFRQMSDENALSWLYQNSNVVRLIDRAVISKVVNLDHFGQKGPAVAENGADLYEHPDSPGVAGLIDVNRKLFERMVAAYQAKGVPVVVLAVTTKCEMGKCFPAAPTDSARKALASSLAGIPVTLIDRSAEYSLDDFWVSDGHWRPSGHRKAADALIPAVRQLLDDRATPAPPRG